MADPFRSSLNRRGFLVLAGAALGAVACKDDTPPAVCTDVSSLDERRKNLRASLTYVEPATDPQRACSKCIQYEAAAEGKCGTCKLDIGPVSPAGSCTVFANA